MESRQPVSLKILSYIGPSMNPILKSGDRLYIAPYDERKVRRGDVIVFISPKDKSRVVHRVVSINPNGIETRGDNCNRIDPWVLSSDQILGRVISVQKAKRRKRVFGGPTGQLYAAVIRSIHALDSNVSSMLRPAYNELAKVSVFIRLLPAQMRPRVVFFNRAAGKELQILMGKRLIGRWLPGKTGWNIKRPYRLFVDEESLPENPGEGSLVRGPLSVANEDL